MTHLFLVRHAQSHSNVKPVVAGPKGDTGLTELGIAQAYKLRARLERTQEIRPDVVISSDLPRARQTAEIVSSLWSLPIIFDSDFREISAGQVDGLTLDEVREKYNLEAFVQDHFHTLAPGGENHSEFLLRATTALKRLITMYEDKTIVVFTHGSIVDSSFYLFFNVSLSQMPPVGFSTQNTAITYWDRVIQPETVSARWRLNCHNDASHLNEW